MSTVVAYVVLALLAAQAFVPARFRLPLLTVTVAVAGALLLVDTPSVPWGVKAVAWLGLVGLVAWRWRKERGLAAQGV